MQSGVPIKGGVPRSGERRDTGLHRRRERRHNEEQMLEDLLPIIPSAGGLLSKGLAHPNDFVRRRLQSFPIYNFVINVSRALSIEHNGTESKMVWLDLQQQCIESLVTRR